MKKALLVLPFVAVLAANAATHHSELPLHSSLDWKPLTLETEQPDSKAFFALLPEKDSDSNNFTVKKDFHSPQHLFNSIYYDAMMSVAKMECGKPDRVSVNKIIYLRGNKPVHVVDLTDSHTPPQPTRLDIFKKAASYICGLGE